MKFTSFILVVALVSFVAIVDAQNPLQHPNHLTKDQSTSLQINQINPDIVVVEDPFLKRTSPKHAKKISQFPGDHEEFSSIQDTEQNQDIYEPFDSNENEEQEKEDYDNDFNELFKIGMLVGSVFLTFVLVKTCSQNRGERRIRNMIEQRRPVVPQPPVGYFYYQHQTQQQPLPVNLNQKKSQEQQDLDQKIRNAETQLLKLKEIKQQALRQEFNRKKIQEEQKKAEFINNQRKQYFQQPRQPTNWNVGYGPIFYGQQQVPISHKIQPHVQQPFHVMGIEPIRKRSNSFKTEISEQPMMQNEVRYKNGIPIGKPLRQNDNDSSFASEYPEV